MAEHVWVQSPDPDVTAILLACLPPTLLVCYVALPTSSLCPSIPYPLLEKESGNEQGDSFVSQGKIGSGLVDQKTDPAAHICLQFLKMPVLVTLSKMIYPFI